MNYYYGWLPQKITEQQSTEQHDNSLLVFKLLTSITIICVNCIHEHTIVQVM